MDPKRKKPNRSARSYALWLLGRQAYTGQQLKDRLLRRGYSAEEAADAVDYLQEINYVNDEAYAVQYVAMRSRAGHGPHKLSRDLKLRGIDPDIVATAVAAVPYEVLLEQAQRLVRRRLQDKRLTDPKVRAGLYRYLLQRGYDYALIEEAVQKVIYCLDRDGLNS
ncbi:MAG: regulatory protein RecX [Firmicutes bacterium]|nr:regulatory protein RecX [Bacillota bacterium]